MIAHGRKQISEIVYARKASEGGGAIRLTNMIRGGAVVFGGLRPSWLWLTAATRAAIVGAFGVSDGTAVIKATNQYLNQLAASDRDKATALAGFINEDPMMVCSLGLQPQGVTMPIRWLVGDGTAYIQTDYYHNANTSYELEVIFMQRSAGQRWPGIFGRKTQNGSADAMSMWLNDTSNVIGGDWRGSNNASSYTITNGVRYVLGERKGGIFFCGTYSTNWGSTQTTQCQWPDYLFAWGNAGEGVHSAVGTLKMRYCKVDESGVLVRNYVPCKHNGQCGMLDIVNVVWFGNANSSGSFTIPDISYTPSTP